MKDKHIYIIPEFHSIIDIITNSSTELFVVLEDKVEPTFRELFKAFAEYAEGRQIDHETEICTLKSYENEHDCSVTLDDYPSLSEDDKKRIWIIDASYHNDFLNLMIRDYLNPIDIDRYMINYNGFR